MKPLPCRHTLFHTEKELRHVVTDFFSCLEKKKACLEENAKKQQEQNSRGHYNTTPVYFVIKVAISTDNIDRQRMHGYLWCHQLITLRCLDANFQALWTKVKNEITLLFFCLSVAAVMQLSFVVSLVLSYLFFRSYFSFILADRLAYICMHRPPLEISTF